MIDRAVLDQVEETIDCFEENWSADSRSNICALLAEYDLVDDYAALTELLRIDIELRYERGLPCQIDDYFDEFSELKEIPGCAAQIAFEDYRARSRNGHSVSSSRWGHLPGVKSEIWFQQLEDSSRRTRIRSPLEKQKFESDPAFESALEEAGFHIVHEIGQGALSRVYLATQQELADRYVVLKVVNLALAEPQSMAMLQHTNIVPIYSFHRILTRSVICMPYAGSVTLEYFLRRESTSHARGGESLMHTVQTGRRRTTIVGHEHQQADTESPLATATPAADESAVFKPLEKLRALGCNDLAIWMFRRLAAALAHSHARGVLHGDLKPGNVLIRNDGEPALLDFNLSQSLDRPTPQLAGGTLPYMSPETYRALMGQEISPQATSDIYSLGVMLFEFVTGRLPYAVPKSIAPIDLQPAIDVRKGAPDWREGDDVSPGLRAIINRCLAFAPGDRYTHAEDLQRDLECEHQNLPLVHAAEPHLVRVKKWTRRHPRVISGGSVASMLLALLIPIGFTAVAWRNESLRLAAMQEFESFADESADVLSTMMVDPRRHEEASILAGLKPLEEFGVLDGSGQHQFSSPLMPEEQRTFERDTLLRHIMHVALIEAGRLRSASHDGPPGDDQLERLDLLIAAAEKIRGDYTSRSLLFLQARRARLAGEIDEANAFSKQARNTEPASDSEIYLDAVRMMVDRRWTLAKELLTGLADRNTIPSTLRWTLLGRSQYTAGEYEDAKLSITQAIERAPQASRLHFMRGLCYLGLSQFARAEIDFSSALRLEPDFVSARLNRGRCRRVLGNLQGAIDDYTRGLGHSPGDAELLLARRSAYRQLGMLEQADQDFAEAMLTDNPSASSFRARAEALADDNPEQAVDDFRRSHQLDPNRINVLTGWARTLSTRLDDGTKQAFDVLTRAVEIAPEYETARIDRAVLLAKLGRFTEAVDETNKALEYPNFSRTLYHAACVYALMPDQANHRKALNYLSQAIRGGYKLKDLADDPNMDSLHGKRDFQAIQRAYQLGNRTGSRLPLSSNDDSPKSSAIEE
jgi:serine/threonine protein kinase/tetratricopeptide (TPR) repeat protein